MRGIRSIDKIVELCERDIGFMWLAQGERPKRDAFYNFINKVPKEIIEDLHYQIIKKFKEKGLITLETLFVDGTKIEANANRYTFVWRGTINYHLVNLLDQVQELFDKYNELIKEKKYDVKYGILKEKMFLVEGAEKVKKIIQENKKRKKINKKKLPNNVKLKIDNIGPESIMRILNILLMISEKEGIQFRKEKGQKKPEIQKIYEAFAGYGLRLEEYKDKFEKMGKDRNSYSKTDIDATFMRMKEDHMKNGQLKPAYNLQFGVENYFIIDVLISNDRTDYNTLIPLITKHELMTDINLKEITADSGYCSEKNLSFIKRNNITSYIKLQEHEKKKTKKYKEDIGKYYNMEEILVDENKQQYAYKCKNNEILELKYKSTSYKNGYKQEFEHYESKNCEGCPFKGECFKDYDEEKHQGQNKKLTVNRNWENLKKEADTNINSEKGIIYRQIRSIQTEGTFGDMKYNDDFRRFNHRSTDKVFKEIIFYVIGRNIGKYYRFKLGKLSEYNGKVIQ